MLASELEHQLGYSKHSKTPKEDANRRNGRYEKTLIDEEGKHMAIQVPRDRTGAFAPQLVPKGVRRFPGFDEKVISLYARGMTVREIRAHLEEIYHTEISPDLISPVTDGVLEEVQIFLLSAGDQAGDLYDQYHRSGQSADQENHQEQGRFSRRPVDQKDYLFLFEKRCEKVDDADSKLALGVESV